MRRQLERNKKEVKESKGKFRDSKAVPSEILSGAAKTQAQMQPASIATTYMIHERKDQVLSAEH